MLTIILSLIIAFLVGLLGYLLRSYEKTQNNFEEVRQENQSKESLLQHIFNDSPVALVFCDEKGFLQDPSPSFLELYKVLKNEIAAKSFWDFIDPDYLPTAKRHLQQCVTDKVKLREVLQTRNSLCEQLWSQVDMIPLEGRVLLVLVNVSSSIKNQELIERFQRGLDQVQILSITDKNGLITYVNDSFSRISGFGPEELVGKSHGIMRSGHHTREFFEKMWNTILAGKTWKGEIKNKSKDGVDFWLETTIMPFTDEAGSPTQFISVSQDITDRKTAEEGLVATLQKIEFENKIWRVIDRVQTNLIILREEKDMVSIVLQIVCEDLGWDYAQIYQRQLNEHAQDVLVCQQHFSMSPSKQESLGVALQAVPLEKGVDLPGLTWQRNQPTWLQELTAQNSRPRPFVDQGIQFSGGLCVPLVVNNIFYGVIETLSLPKKPADAKVSRAMVVIASYLGKVLERQNQDQREREYKDQLAFSAKMSTLGEMASGIAHEINNPLAIIVGYASGALTQLNKGDVIDPNQLQRIFDRIVSTSSRIGKIVKGLRSFARDGSADNFVPTTVKSIIEDTLSLCEMKLKNGRVNLQLAPYDESLVLECRAVQVSQILINLINNAVDAIEDVKQKWVRIEVIDHGDALEFLVVDAGLGIPEAVAQKIMQPFFTTKAIGKGTGLGLSIARGIAESHSGSFGIHNDRTNTTFFLRLPKRQLNGAMGPSDKAA